MIEDYLVYLKDKAYSQRTQAYSQGVLQRFAVWLWNEKDRRLKDACPQDLEAYLLDLKDKAHKEKGIQTICSILRSFYRFARRRGLMLQDPTERLPPFTFRRKEPLRKIPSPNEVEWLLSKPNTKTLDGLRDKAILETFYSSGLRNKELRDLLVGDADFQSEVLSLRFPKGGRGRILPLGRIASFWIQRYLKDARPWFIQIPEENHLFLTIHGREMKDSNIRYIFLRYRKDKRHLTAHALRHAMAVHMLKGGAPIHLIQRMLGHRRLSTTQIYTRLSIEDLKETQRKYHPREGKPLEGEEKLRVR